MSDNIIKEYEQLISKKNTSKSEFDDFNTKVKQRLNKINEKIQMCTTMFNSLICEIGNLLKREFPYDQSMVIYSGVVNDITKNKPSQAISFFITNIYSNDNYRKYINEGNDNFFLGNTYDDISNSNENNAKAIFQFKSSWAKLSDDDKNYIKDVMKTLLKISAQFLNEKDLGNDLVVIMAKLEKL